MDGDYISRQEHDEFARRMESENKLLAEEDKRQNHRITVLEETMKQINSLTVSVERMATNMENMLGELKKQRESIKGQGERIGKLEIAPAEYGKQVKGAIITSVVSAVVGAIVGAVLMLL